MVRWPDEAECLLSLSCQPWGSAKLAGINPIVLAMIAVVFGGVATALQMPNTATRKDWRGDIVAVSGKESL